MKTTFTFMIRSPEGWPLHTIDVPARNKVEARAKVQATCVCNGEWVSDNLCSQRVTRRFNRTGKFWEIVRAGIASQAGAWSCGTEGRLLFDNLVENDEWLSRCIRLAPKDRSFGPRDLAHRIVYNYFSRSQK